MKLITLIMALGLATSAVAADRHLPISRCCKSLTSFDLIKTEAMSGDWVRADVREVWVSGSLSGTAHIWYANCASPRIVVMRDQVGAAARLVAGEGEQFEIYGLVDPDMKTTAIAICERHAAAQPSEGTK
ncbi:MAG: hypothetical protein AAF439_00630 [Pseudomonadota bacterium]